MQYISYYDSPLGKMLLAADEIGLTGVWFDEQKYFARCLDEAYEEKEIPLFADVKKWFDVYFSAKKPDISIPLHLVGTKFQMEVWEYTLYDSLWKNDDLRRNCQTDRFQKRDPDDVRTGCGRSCWAQSCFCDRAVSQSHRDKRKLDRICRRN